MTTAVDVLTATPAARNRKPLVVLLSDGRQEDTAPVLAQGQRARQLGIEVFTVGLGGDVDPGLLRQLATDATHAYLAPSPDELRGIYEAVARAIPCR